MSQTMIIWFVIAAILSAIFLTRAIVAHAHSRHTPAVRHKFITLAKDRDIFFIPGDTEDDDEIDY